MTRATMLGALMGTLVGSTLGVAPTCWAQPDRHPPPLQITAIVGTVRSVGPNCRDCSNPPFEGAIVTASKAEIDLELDDIEFDAEGHLLCPEFARCAITDAAGFYRIGGIPTGSYVVQAFTRDAKYKSRSTKHTVENGQYPPVELLIDTGIRSNPAPGESPR